MWHQQHRLHRNLISLVLPLAWCSGVLMATAQQGRHPLDPPVAAIPAVPQHRTRLILKDGSYQVVLSYRVVGERVRYTSAERNGEEEEIPLSLVNLPATKAWEQDHDPMTAGQAERLKTPVLSPELAQEEALRVAQTPEVVKDLRLPTEDDVLVLDTFRGTPELVPLAQNGSDLNRETAHEVVRREINPASSPHDLLLVKDEQADVQLHVPDPTFFVRLETPDPQLNDAGGFVVDTHGQARTPISSGGAKTSRYVLEHVDVRQGARAVQSLQLRKLGTGQAQPNIIEVHQELLPGGIWLKLVPSQPLEIGEYALVEVLDGRSVNADVWDFGVHPTAKENDEALKPEPKRPARLEKRGR